MGVRGMQRKRDSAIALSEEDLFERLVHDLRNPLGVIAYFAEAVATASPAEHDDLCVRLRVNAQRLLHVLEEFSLLADLRSDRYVVGERSDLGAAIDQLASELETMERRPGRIRRRQDPVVEALPGFHGVGPGSHHGLALIERRHGWGGRSRRQRRRAGHGEAGRLRTGGPWVGGCVGGARARIRRPGVRRRWCLRWTSDRQHSGKPEKNQLPPGEFALLCS